MPKKKSIVVLRTPFDVGGTFADPSVTPDLGTLGARVGGAIALGLINPLLALIPLIETGPGHDEDCSALLAKVKDAPVVNTNAQGRATKVVPPKKARAAKASASR